MSNKRKCAIVLFFLQAVSVAGGLIGGTFNEMGIIGFIGYFLPATVGIILLILDKRDKTKTGSDKDEKRLTV